VTGAPEALARALEGQEGVSLHEDAQAKPAVVIRIAPPPEHAEARLALLAAIRAEARARTPVRVNAVIVGSLQASLAVIDYLWTAEAVTGQVLAAET
jgi:hypothetical protein